jgi:hypothetical protein
MQKRPVASQTASLCGVAIDWFGTNVQIKMYASPVIALQL